MEFKCVSTYIIINCSTVFPFQVIIIIIIIIIIRVLCPRAGLQCKGRNLGCWSAKGRISDWSYKIVIFYWNLLRQRQSTLHKKWRYKWNFKICRIWGSECPIPTLFQKRGWNMYNWNTLHHFNIIDNPTCARCAGSDGSMSASGSEVWGSIPGGVVNFYLKFSTSGLGGVEMYTF